MNSKARIVKFRRLLNWVLSGGAALLLLPVIRRVDPGSLGTWASGFGVVPVLIFLLYQVAAWILMGERWRFFCREHGIHVSLTTAGAARLLSFAWSYITPGPHVGGEAAQIAYLKRRGFPASAIIPALLRDRAYEFVASLFAVSFLVLLPRGGSPDSKAAAWMPAAAGGLLLICACIITGSRRAYRIVQTVLLIVSGRSFSRRRKSHRFLADLLRNPAAVKRRRLTAFLIYLSLLQAAFIAAAELMLFFTLSGAPLSWREALILAAVSRGTHYAPVPGGIGVYDAGMVGAAGWIGIDYGIAAAYVLVTRFRDLVLIGFGLLVGTRTADSSGGS